MRFIHISDVHLGAEPDPGKPWCQQRSREIWHALERITARAEEEQADFLLIAGDFFHRQPLVRELKEVNHIFSRLTRTRVVFIAGNHDYIKPDSNYINFKWNKNVYPLLGEGAESIYFEDCNTSIYGFSYHKREIREALYDDLEPDNEKHINILLAHGGDEKHIPVHRNKIERSLFDYIALGHIHKPGILAENKALYSGALEPVDVNDTGKHGYVSGEITKKGLKLRFISFSAREYIHKKIMIDRNCTAAELRDRVQEAVRESGEENLYKIIVTGRRDPDTIFDYDRIGQLGNIVQVVDETEPGYDLEQLSDMYQGHMIGRYMKELEGGGKTEKKALYYGLHALLGAKR